MKGINVCGECGNYDWKKHRCRIGCIDDSNAQAKFYGDCPLPDVVPKSEVEKLKMYIDDLNDSKEHLVVMLEEAKIDAARVVFEEIDEAMIDHARGEIDNHWLYVRIEEIKKKYTEGK